MLDSVGTVSDTSGDLKNVHAFKDNTWTKKLRTV